MSDRLSDIAAEGVVWAIVADVAKQRKDEARAILAARMGPDVAAVKAVANGATVGRASWVEGKEAVAVVNPALFAMYVEDNFPDEMIRYVNPAFQKQFLSGLQVVDGTVIDRNGEPVPGVDVRTSAAYVAIKKADQARATVEALLSSGRLALDGIKALEEGQ